MDERSMDTVIAAAVEINGTVKSKGALRVDGKLEGELHCEQDAVIGKDAVIKGNISVQSVTVEGTVEGNITARDRVELKGEARMTGDLKAKRLVVQEGVTFVGRSDVNPSGSPSGAAPVPEAPVSKPTEKPLPEKTPAPDKETDDRESRGGIFGRR